MRFSIEQRYAAPLHEVEEAYCSPELLARLTNLPKVGGAELLDQRVEGEHVLQRVRYRFTGDLNAAVTAVVDPRKLTWIEESDLDRATHRTTWRIVPDNYRDRLQCAGTFQLSETPDGGTLRRFDAEIKVNFPLVGGRVEKAIVSGLEEYAQGEKEVVAAYLLGG